MMRESSFPVGHLGRAVETATVRLQRSGADEFDDILADVMAQIARSFGTVAMRERNSDPDQGMTWFDPSATDHDEVDEVTEVAERLEGGIGLGGPSSIMAPSGRPALVVPSPPGSPFRRLEVLAADPAGFSEVETAVLGVFAATVFAARDRIVAMQELEGRLNDQEFLNGISSMAAIDSPDALHRLLVTVAEQFRIASATVWEVDGDELRLVESSLQGPDRHVERGVVVSIRREDFDLLVRSGHARLDVGETPARSVSPFAADLPTLIVPMVGPDGGEGVLALIDPGDMRVSTATSVARSAQKMRARWRAIEENELRAATEQFLRETAGVVGTASYETELEVLDEILHRLTGHFGVGAAAIWWRSDGGPGLERRRSLRRDGTVDESVVEMDSTVVAAERLAAHGYLVLNHEGSQGVNADVMEPTDSVLVVPLGGSHNDSGVLILHGDEDRHWDEMTITACRTAGLIVGQGLARFDAERTVARRLELTQLSHRVAGLAVDAQPETADATLVEILKSCVEFFDLSEAQIWRLEGDVAIFRLNYRADGSPGPDGSVVPLHDRVSVDTRGFLSIRLRELAVFSERPLRDPETSRVLITPYAAIPARLGVVVFVDPSARWWSQDELNAIRAITDTIGQLNSRMLVTRALGRQQVTERLLHAAASAFVDATPETLWAVVDEVLESLRAHLGSNSVAVFELDSKTLEITCPSEATVDGKPLQGDYAPLRRDDPAVRRLLDPEHGPEWRFTDLIGLPEEADRTNLVVVSPARDEDVLILSAVNRFGVPFAVGAVEAVQSLGGLLAQVRGRIQLERATALRSDADRLLGEIAADFVERSGDDLEAGFRWVIRRVGELFELRSVSLWIADGSGGLDLVARWGGSDSEPPTEGNVDPDDPFVRRCRAAPSVFTMSIESEGDVPGLGDITCNFAPISDTGGLLGVLGTTDARPSGPVLNPEILTDFLDALAQLFRQLWRRLEADAAIGRRLESEDLLLKFATRLAAAPTSPDDSAAEAFGWLMAQLDVDHASVWRLRDDEHTTGAELRMQWGASDAFSVSTDARVLSLGAGRGVADVVDAGAAEWPIDDDNPVAAMAREALGLESSHRVMWLGDQGDWRLLFTRPGVSPMPQDLVTSMKTALSVIGQHEARTTAERAFSTAFSSAPIAICLRDRQGSLLSCNQAYVDLTGWSEDELTGSMLDMVISPEHLHDAVDDLGTLVRGEQVAREFAYRRRDGDLVWARARTSLVEIPGHNEPVYVTYSEDITESRRSRQLLEYQATHDELTGLPNRRAFVAQVAAELTYGLDFSVLILDLDRFKLVNDSMGHGAGDFLLIACADRIRLSLRPGDVVCRLGGDEFAVLLRSPADAAAAAVVADRLLRLLSEPLRIDDEEVFPSTSIGIAIPEPADDVDELMRHADAAMYEAKGQGRDRWVRFDRSMRDAVLERVRTESDLRRAVEHGQLEVHYQPEFMLDSDEIVGAEALVRWRHPSRGLLSAGSFIALAEETGLVVEIGRWVLGVATTKAAEWVAAGHDLIVRVNLSTRQLRPAIVTEVQEALTVAGLAPERLCLEITETAIMDDVQDSARMLQEFRDLGVLIAIDDFGTGFSSLAYLKRLPVDILKIDRTFVDGVGVDPDDTAIVRSIIGLAHTLRLDVVAEGIEDRTQIAELVRLGCSRGQGFHLAQPAPPDALELLLAPRPTEV